VQKVLAAKSVMHRCFAVRYRTFHETFSASELNRSCGFNIATKLRTSNGGLRSYQRGAKAGGLGNGSPRSVGSPRSWRHILKITIASIVSCDRCINIEFAVFAE